MAVTKYTKGSMNWSASTWGQLVPLGVMSHPVTKGVLTPAVSPNWTIDALIGTTVEINGVNYTVDDNDTSWLQISVAGPANGTYSWILFNEGPPGDGDTACLNPDFANITMDIPTIPASGTLAEIASRTSAGVSERAYILCTMTDAIFALPGGIINSELITGGGNFYATITGVGNDDTHLLTINCTTITSAGNGSGVSWGGTASLVINGNLLGGSSAGGTGLTVAGLNAITINGNVTGGAANTSVGIFHNGTGTITVSGIVSGGITGGASAYYGVWLYGAGSLICSEVVGTTGNGMGIYNKADGTITVTSGGVTAGTANSAYGIYNLLTGVVTVEAGGVVGGGPDSHSIYGIYNAGAGTITVEAGGATGGSSLTSYGIFNQSATGIVNVSGTITGGSGVNAYGIYNALGGVVTLEDSNTSLVSGTGGVAYAGYPPVWNPADTDSVTWNGALFVLGTTFPSEDDVRDGVDFNSGGSTGNLELPTESNVKVGVTFGTDGTEYTGALALDFPSEDDVRDGVDFNDGIYTGNMTVPSIANVLNGVTYGTSGTEYTGVYLPDHPSEDDVRFGVSFNAGVYTGNMTLPAISNVRTGITFGTSGIEYTGDVTLPPESVVNAGYDYGSGGTEYTGTLISGGVFPDEDDVKLGTVYGLISESTGNLVIPVEGDVRQLVSFGAEGTEYQGTLRIPVESAVQYGYLYGADSVEYTGSLVPYF